MPSAMASSISRSVSAPVCRALTGVLSNAAHATDDVISALVIRNRGTFVTRHYLTPTPRGVKPRPLGAARRQVVESLEIMDEVRRGRASGRRQLHHIEAVEVAGRPRRDGDAAAERIHDVLHHFLQF